MNRLEIVKDTAMEYIIMMDNGVMDGQLTQEEYNEAVSFEKVYDYTLSEANQECKFLGGKILNFLVHEAIEEYA
ncbi:hypothetical protein FMLHJGGC_00079 [Staphylococcus phage BSwM-KMM1]|nr:hypothetical protein FMLHJGGC_00079 [Pseudomonas phage BSwM KMM1]